MSLVVTIDGPAASGKSSVSRELAKRLGWQWVSTGAFYRGLGYAAIQLKVSLDDVQNLAALCDNPIWSVRMSDEKTLVFFKDQDVTDLIACENVGAFASRVSLYPEVRKSLLQIQRRCSTQNEKGLVAEGRDCGTVVFPNASVKVFLTASSVHRAARRAAEHGADVEEIQKAQMIRDQQDSTRKAAPMQVPENAYVVDTTTMNLDQVVDSVEKHVQDVLKKDIL